MVREQLGKEIYLPFIYSLFFFILISNLIGNIPYSYTITTSVIVTIGLSFTILTGVTILGLYIHRLHFFSYFVPSGTPLALVPLLVLIETVSYLARALSLGIRLFANMVAGHSLLKYYLLSYIKCLVVVYYSYFHFNSFCILLSIMWIRSSCIYYSSLCICIISNIIY